jgi:hypothetical protein
MTILTLTLPGLAMFLSGCLAAPLAVEATVEVVTIALRTTDPNYAPRLISQPTITEHARAECSQNDAGPETEGIDYMSHLTGSCY